MTAFAVLDFAGADAASFLQGYATADLDELRQDSALPTAFCNIKGRVFASGWAVGEERRVRLVVHRSVVATIEGELGKYLLFAKSELTKPKGNLSFAAEASADAVALPPTGWFATFDTPADAGHGAFADACATAGFVAVEQAVSQAFLPQMIGLTDAGAVSFAKGCYLGQEVVARAEHRGEVKQKLRRYRCQGELPTVGVNVMDEDRKAGIVVAVGKDVVLATTRVEGALTVGASRLTATDTPG